MDSNGSQPPSPFGEIFIVDFVSKVARGLLPGYYLGVQEDNKICDISRYIPHTPIFLNLPRTSRYDSPDTDWISLIYCVFAFDRVVQIQDRGFGVGPR